MLFIYFFYFSLLWTRQVVSCIFGWSDLCGFPKCVVSLFMNAKSGFLFTLNGIWLRFGFLKRDKIVLKLSGNQFWCVCSGDFNSAGLNLCSGVLILKFVLFLEALKLIQTLGHVVNFLHRPRVCALVLRHWVGSRWFLCFNRRWSGDSISRSSCAGVSCLPSTLVQFILQSINFCFLFSDLLLPLLDLRCNRLVHWYLLLWTRLIS